MKGILGLAIGLAIGAFSPPALAASKIPFVGCVAQAAGAVGSDWTAPTGKSVMTDLPPAIAARLAVYASNWSAVLAPRGWVCRSSVVELQGVAMLVSPRPAPGDERAVLSGPAIILWNDQRDATVAAYAGRYFPKTVPAILAAGDVCGAGCKILLDPKNGPPKLAPWFSSDVIRHRGKFVLDYFTPADQPGLGHQIGPAGSGAAALPAYGVLALSGRPRGQGGVVNLTVRLPEKLSALRPAIIDTLKTCLPDKNLVACESGGAFVAQGTSIDDGD